MRLWFCFVLLHADLLKQPGRIAVITGGNRGIGADVVEKLLRCEINVVMGKCVRQIKSNLKRNNVFE